jgi:hypothetical protein
MGVLLIHGKTPTMQHHKALGQDYFPDSLLVGQLATLASRNTQHIEKY